MNLTECARHQRVHPQIAYRWFRDGTLPAAVRIKSRSVLIARDAVLPRPIDGLGLYARVSSQDQRADLDRQVTRLSAWAANTGLPVKRVESEVGSAVNGAPTKVGGLLADPRVTAVVVGHRDSLGRMNIELIEAALLAGAGVWCWTRDVDDLARDMTEVLTSFCAPLYRRRSAPNRARKALRARHDRRPDS